MTDKDDSEPKIIVDSDWKEQVAKEKEAAAQQPAAPQAAGAVEAEASGARPPGNSDDFVPKQSTPKQPATEPASQAAVPPPASFEVLVSMLFTQGMAMLGQLPDPADGETQVNKPFAKHTIDTLELLGEKTTGNLTDAEAKLLSEALHALRMAYVNTPAR